MTNLEFLNLFTTVELGNIYGNRVNSPTFATLWDQCVSYTPGGIMFHDSFAAIVNILNDNSLLDDMTRYSTLMAVQPIETSGPDIRVV